ncbi:unnamed protein product [Cylicocyclus nassatus]|uniref:Ras modification protein ERF4 n=1 Tax=Cylicocyclus nassatus TaxID=53992 RepID=A0AA36HFV3_CYLNA|nr:unnamed protein product [Cylicocyclus nassatus]
MHDMQRVTLSDKRRVVIQRDYSSGLGIKFNSAYPPDLTSHIDEDTWTKFICELNYEYECAEKITTRTVMETVLGCLSCYITRFCVRPSFYKRLDEIAEYLERTNREILIPRGLYAKNPIEKGFRVMEIYLIYETNDPKKDTYQNVPKPQSFVPRL